MKTASTGRRDYLCGWAEAAGLLQRGEPLIIAAGVNIVLAYAGATIDTASMAQLIARTSGFVQVALPTARCDALHLPEAAPTIRDTTRPSYGQCVTVDAAESITTGISAADRARTVRVLCDPTTVPTDLTRPGHVVPMRAVDAQQHRKTTAVSALVSLTDSIGAAFADLTSLENPLQPVSLREAHRLAATSRTAFLAEWLHPHKLETTSNSY
ncbi:3,4-dihydroxy-2-butanone 4-phosphate synthase [Rhodococcus sp. Eu-32]|uniref:3,4-dihydroxy-2-butanone-4-phosphate synthase n=1 Tax=Rhodococcus sp. Eu-32 TaxID=1017319 RepID=UPI000DF478AC|nr:3,4-dihydroxy-2-butanone-4-phosphate synthase [Rhodococcus sp. Eu-32]RRQ25533.1 3,4-dihydroxy-2-butanone 4-phosphate synthase [Rhodococcus sp. Eu-32]